MAVSKGSLVGGIRSSTGLALGACGYLLVAAVVLRAASEALPTDSVTAFGSALVLLGGVLLWLGSVILPRRF